MNWELFICGIALVIIGVATLICLSAGYAASQPTPPLHNSISTWRNPGETDSDMADRLLNASPYHQAALKGKDR